MGSVRRASIVGALMGFSQSVKRLWPAGRASGGDANPMEVLRERVLKRVLEGMFACALLELLVVVPWFAHRKIAGIVICAIAMPAIVISLLFLKRGRVKPASWITMSILGLVCLILVVFEGGIISPALPGMLLFCVTAAWLFGQRFAHASAIAVSGLAFILTILAQSGILLPQYFPLTPIPSLFLIVMLVLLGFLPVNLVLGTLNDTLQHTREQVEELREAESALRASEARYRALVETLPDGVMLTDTGGRVTFCNRRAAEMHGYTQPSELIGMPSVALVAARDRDRARRETALTLACGFLKNVEYSMVRKDGSEFPGELTATVIRHDDDKIRGVMVVTREVTERKQAEMNRLRLEERLRQAQKLESVGRLAGGIAHDFNNHLTVINGYCDLILAEMGPDDRRREELEAVLRAGEKAASLATQLLAFSRKQSPNPRPILLNEVVHTVEGLLRRLVRSEVEIVKELAREPGTVVADPGQIEQVLMNLAVNATDAISGRGRITVRTANRKVEQEIISGQGTIPPGSYAVLSVEDNGTGMDEKTLKFIFEPFFTTKEVGKGTGLGLAMVYGIVKQSGGYITVNTEVGRGSEFAIYLPRVRQQAVTLSGPRTDEPAGTMGEGTVLLVEDQEAVRRLASQILRTQGYEVLEAASGPEALSIPAAELKNVRLLVTDLMMPNMTGQELAKRLTALLPKMRILYMSGYAPELIDREGWLDPKAPWLLKPFTAAQFAARVRDVLAES